MAAHYFSLTVFCLSTAYFLQSWRTIFMTIIWLFIFMVKRIREIGFSGLDRNKPTYQLHQLPSVKPAEAAGESKSCFVPVIYINSYSFQTLRAISAFWPKRKKKCSFAIYLGRWGWTFKRGDAQVELIVLVLMRTFCTTRQGIVLEKFETGVSRWIT